jgi:hypothetical protein
LTWTWKVSKEELEGLAASKRLSASIKTALEKEVLEFGKDEKARRISLLSHVLSPEFPEARILSFAYNSDWFINAPAVTATQIARRLLGQLTSVRSNNLVRSKDSF